MSATRELTAVARLDLAEVARSRWLVFCLAVYALLGVVFVFVGLRESTVLGFTGMGRVFLSLSHALVVLLPLLALSATVHVINRARDEGGLELLFSLPLRRSTYFVAVSLTRYVALLLPLVAVLVALVALGWASWGEAIAIGQVGRTLAVCASLLFAFVALGIAISTWVRNQARALVWMLLVWALCVALLDFALVGSMLRWRLHPQVVFLLASLNPVQAARLALLSGADAELATLGPVGFYLATRLGALKLLVVGTLWPLLLGLAAWSLALLRFRRGDLV